jgi:hypothetical protein
MDKVSKTRWTHPEARIYEEIEKFQSRPRSSISRFGEYAKFQPEKKLCEGQLT